MSQKTNICACVSGVCAMMARATKVQNKITRMRERECICRLCSLMSLTHTLKEHVHTLSTSRPLDASSRVAVCRYAGHTLNSRARPRALESRHDTRARAVYQRERQVNSRRHVTPTSRHGASCPRSASCLRLDSPPPPLSQPQPPPTPSPPLQPPPPPPAFLLPPHVYTALAFG